LALLLCIGLQQPQLTRPLDLAAEEHVRRLIESLPADSRWRGMLEHGATGDGVHRPWMDDMQRAGVKLAVVEFEFEWTQRGRQIRDWTLAGIQYFRDYDRSDAITDPRQFSQINASGLGRELADVALPRAKSAHWFELPRHRHGLGYKDVRLADDEWLPVALGPEWFRSYQPGLTPLMKVALHGDAVRIEKLVSEGANVNAADRHGMTPLMWAAASGCPAAVKALLAARADVNANPGRRGDVLAGAVANGQVQIVRVLLQSGANPNSKDGYGRSALSIASTYHYDEIAQLLKQAGARD
jgi:ankyrin repeat protein